MMCIAPDATCTAAGATGDQLWDNPAHTRYDVSDEIDLTGHVANVSCDAFPPLGLESVGVFF